MSDTELLQQLALYLNKTWQATKYMIDARYCFEVGHEDMIYDCLLGWAIAQQEASELEEKLVAHRTRALALLNGECYELLQRDRV